MKLDERMYYEVIQETRPCRLYFDLEYSLKDNPETNPDAMMTIFKDFCAYEIQKIFGIAVSQNDIVDLCSSSDYKFSRHLIIHLSKCIFMDNAQVGRFVGHLVSEIQRLAWFTQDDQWTSSLQQLFIKDEQGNKILFVDEGVYSRNRNFRLFLSSKAGKRRPLMVSRTSGRIPSDCSVSNGRLMRKGSKSLIPEPADELDLESFFFATLVSPWPIPNGSRLLTFQESASPIHLLAGDTTLTSRHTKRLSDGPVSPFPDVDAFLLWTLSNRDFEPSLIASISKSVYFKESKFLYKIYNKGNTIVYSIVGDRFCYNVGRQHKSNGIYYVADLSTNQLSQRLILT